ncbi:MAG TPA: hypothetical protein VEK55_05880, partial [Xanthobacteraceae bacterium]|nr:hypothetical protein [Xanthobacteraceae bacterium]
GNLAALDALDALVAAETAPTTVVFNGDFHWFDAQPGWFMDVEARLRSHRCIRGNVETELGRADDVGAGCGCAYPPSVDDDTVRRSNLILEALRATAVRLEGMQERLSALPAHLVADVADVRVGIVHGDATSLAGWGFDGRALDDPTRRAWLAEIGRASRIDVFASAHTCAPALRTARLPSGPLTLINNGAAGMPNFAATPFGVLSRIAASASPHRPLYGVVHGRVHVDAIALPYDAPAFLQRFLRRWPPGSAAHRSYFQRIVAGPDLCLAQARPPAFAGSESR